MEQKIDLKNLEVSEIEQALQEIGEQKFRAKQIFQWIHKGINEFNKMTNVSVDLQSKLSDKFYIGEGRIVQKLESEIDETKKYLIMLKNNDVVETVLMKYKYGYSICISSQVGCRMGCKFCASTLNGLVRNLEPGEILEQVLIVSKDIGQRISNIVIMGIGEPLDNFENILKFLKLINSKDGINLGYRNITLSTCGLVPKMIELSKKNIPITIAISLHAPNDEIRKQIMPIANKYSVNEILDACKKYINNTNRRITFEYAMISGLNDGIKHAEELSAKLKSMLCHVNLIPINNIKESTFRRSSLDKILTFQKILQGKGIETTIRRELGKDINASCGQLRNSHNSEEA